jgi:hypothetical protein
MRFHGISSPPAVDLLHDRFLLMTPNKNPGGLYATPVGLVRDATRSSSHSLLNQDPEAFRLDKQISPINLLLLLAGTTALQEF